MTFSRRALEYPLIKLAKDESETYCRDSYQEI
jgi:hypothetical protein